MTPLEVWDRVVAGKSLFAARDDADFCVRLARAVAALVAEHDCAGVWIGGGGAARADLAPSLASLPVPVTISPLLQFAGAPGGFALAASARPLVVDVGQTAVKLMARELRLRVERDPQLAARDLIAGAIARALPRAGAVDALVLALPAEIDDALVPAGCSYHDLAGDAELVEVLRARVGLDGVPALVLNDAELAAVTAQHELDAKEALPLLTLTLGYGVGAALVTRRHTPAPRP